MFRLLPVDALSMPVKTLFLYQHVFYPLWKLIPILYEVGSTGKSHGNVIECIRYHVAQLWIRFMGLECRKHKRQIKFLMKRCQVSQTLDSDPLDLHISTIQQGKTGSLYPSPICDIIGYTQKGVGNLCTRSLSKGHFCPISGIWLNSFVFHR